MKYFLTRNQEYSRSDRRVLAFVQVPEMIKSSKSTARVGPLISIKRKQNDKAINYVRIPIPHNALTLPETQYVHNQCPYEGMQGPRAKKKLDA
jgi:hypothetical protein